MTGAEAPGLPRLHKLEKEFRLIRELGTGASSVVYLAETLGAPRPRDRTPEGASRVAIKMLRPTHRGDQDAEARLIREARTMAHLEHPGILRLLGTRRVERSHLALIMEYIDGMTLQERIRDRGPLPLREVHHVVRSVGEALVYLQRKLTLHRDLKPGNIYIEAASQRVILADFGIARNWEADAGLDLAYASHGTPAYMSPEQVAGDSLDGRSDLYSLGLVAFEMLTGRSPWAGTPLARLLERQRSEPLPPVARLRPGIPPGLARAIDRALAKNPDDRWPDAGAMLGALSDSRPLTPEELGSEWHEPPSPPPVDEAWEYAPTLRYTPGTALPTSPPPPRDASPAPPIPAGGSAGSRRRPAARPSPAPEPAPAPRPASRPAPPAAIVIAAVLLALLLGLVVWLR